MKPLFEGILRHDCYKSLLKKIDRLRWFTEAKSKAPFQELCSPYGTEVVLYVLAKDVKLAMENIIDFAEELPRFDERDGTEKYYFTRNKRWNKDASYSHFLESNILPVRDYGMAGWSDFMKAVKCNGYEAEEYGSDVIFKKKHVKKVKTGE